MNLSEETIQKIDEVIPNYPEKRSAALMVIHLVQEELGSIDLEACEWIAEKLELQPINIQELITFYPMLREKPWGREACSGLPNLPCAFVEAMRPVKTLKKNLEVKEGHVSR